jgi:hypothetical protein
MYVSMHVNLCMYVCMHLCFYVFLYVNMSVSMFSGMHFSLKIRLLCHFFYRNMELLEHLLEFINVEKTGLYIYPSTYGSMWFFGHDQYIG